MVITVMMIARPAARHAHILETAFAMIIMMILSDDGEDDDHHSYHHDSD